MSATAAFDILQGIQPASVRAVCYRLFTAEMAEQESIETVLSTWPSISGQASKYEETHG